MALNPYAKYLDQRTPLAIAADTPAQLNACISKMGDAGLSRSYAPGKWTAAQILCHLADIEITWGFRVRQAVAQPHHTIQTFEQDDWAKPYRLLDPHAALAAFLALRRWNLAFLATVPQSEYAKQVTHPERGTMTLEGLLQTLAGHDLNHLQQLRAIADA